MNKTHLALALSCCCALLQACGAEQQGDTAANAEAAAPQTAAPAQSFAHFNTTATIRDVMNTLIDPHADNVWTAVSYVVTEDGVEEHFPQTDEDWADLRASAISMIEGANSLMIPGRAVAPPGATTEFPEYEYEPAEVERELAADWDSWVGFAQSFQQTTLLALDAIERRDITGLEEVGSAIDSACEGCHGQYWYRDL